MTISQEAKDLANAITMVTDARQQLVEITAYGGMETEEKKCQATCDKAAEHLFNTMKRLFGSK
jgi:hypothetical protein